MLHANLKEVAGDAEPPKAEDAEPLNKAEIEKKEEDEKDVPALDENDDDEGMPAHVRQRITPA